MLRELRLKNFKAFKSFVVGFQGASYLVGPNSAGKSTILAALRLSEACLRYARSYRADVNARYPVPTRGFEMLHESVRHDFRNLETSLTLTWKSGTKLQAIWPLSDDSGDVEGPYFYLQKSSSQYIKTPSGVKESFVPIGVIPALTPLESEERLLNDSYVRENVSARLSSRHFRNRLRLLDSDGQWDRFIDYAAPWLGGLSLRKPVVQYGDNTSIDVFFTEPGSNVEKELVWAGDGIQVWLQILMQLYQFRDLPTLVLDEPEVFLHADLQRRVVRLLEGSDRQIILATHSSEILAEVSHESIVWVDKSKTRAVRGPKSEQLGALDSALGSAFNLAMARALRARAVLFVEGKDVKTLRIIAASLGRSSIISDTNLAVVPINGFSHWPSVESFGWLLRGLLDDSVKAMVLLDRDYRTDAQVALIQEKLSDAGITARTWRRKELESYLLSARVIAKISKAPVDRVSEIIDSSIQSFKGKVRARLLSEAHSLAQSSGTNLVTTAEKVLEQFETDWLDEQYRLMVCPPKEILSAVNSLLQSSGFKAASFDGIAKNLTIEDVPQEMVNLLDEIEGLSNPDVIVD